MTRYKNKIFGIVLAALAIGILSGTQPIMMSALATGTVPEWFRGVAGFWAEGLIST